MNRFRLLIPQDAQSAFKSLPEPLGKSPHSENLMFEWVSSHGDPDIKQRRLGLNRRGVTAIYYQVRQWKAAFFDMDSTVIGQETIVELAACGNKQQEVSDITEAAMAGKLDFNQALQQRVATLQGLPVSIFEEVKQRLVINPGMVEFSSAANKQGLGLYLVSGGFIPFVRDIAATLGFAGSHGNHLDEKDGYLLGTVSGTIVDAAEKKAFLLSTVEALQLDPKEALAVGDGANDLEMMSAAGLAIGYKPKELLLPHVDGAIFDSHLSLLDILN